MTTDIANQPHAIVFCSGLGRTLHPCSGGAVRETTLDPSGQYAIFATRDEAEEHLPLWVGPDADNRTYFVVPAWALFAVQMTPTFALRRT